VNIPDDPAARLVIYLDEFNTWKERVLSDYQAALARLAVARTRPSGRRLRRGSPSDRRRSLPPRPRGARGNECVRRRPLCLAASARPEQQYETNAR
jgi:hypothetical protein